MQARRYPEAPDTSTAIALARGAELTTGGGDVDGDRALSTFVGLISRRSTIEVQPEHFYQAPVSP